MDALGILITQLFDIKTAECLILLEWNFRLYIFQETECEICLSVILSIRNEVLIFLQNRLVDNILTTVLRQRNGFCLS
ncbi:hypothetical protein A2348_03730 [Candidatus Uhrbacteria bacterium RIFOXYB12_FULL_58_10]|nr:MAG: hypothetical protein A2348_03730 [Candidatus Uhrbacteria bacterium RIFOXYB12_FULL_58_10]